MDRNYHGGQRLVGVFTIAQSKLLDIFSIVILAGNREVNLALIVLSNLQDTVSPVVGAWKRWTLIYMKFQTTHPSDP